jgi:hypothetical protein
MYPKDKYTNDFQHFDYYKKLLEPGWAGELSPDEFAFVKSELRKSLSLKRRWGFRPTAKRLSEHKIREVARNGISANQKLVLASPAREERASKY